MAGMESNGLNAAADGFAAAFGFLSLHSADPGTGGTSETSAARVAAAWGAAAAGAVTSTSKAFTGGASSGACTHVGYWSASSGGTFGGSRPLTGDQAFNAAGEYTVDSVTETFSSA
jgi:hypothetical protein